MDSRSFLCAVLIALCATVSNGGEASQAIEAIRAVGPKGEGHMQASRAAVELSNASLGDLTLILQGMDGANPLATNWLRVAAEAVAGRALDQGQDLPVAQLESFALDRSHSPRPRRLAYELIVRVDESAPDRLMPQMLDDTSLELRRDAVQRVLDAAEIAEGERALALYSQALHAARDLDQLKTCFEVLEKLDSKVNIAEHMGFVTKWHLIAPFDNTAGKGYEAVYPPEHEIDLAAEYDGKEQKVRWVEAASDDPYGIVDLATTLSKFKGAVCYATTEISSPAAQTVDFRLGCINACKLWVNGDLIDSHEVYHAGMEVDQYIAPVELKAGTNRVLLKVCQNEQEESWAQRWQFQLRVTDALGGAARVKVVSQ
ncbi:MAG: hypothetical protein KDA42_00875 [Planctomycetales bacterium]|nr:hypothetical protein [Planctomycetales bacterium]